MLDINFIREHLDAVNANCRNRNVQGRPRHASSQLDDERKRLVQEAQVKQQRTTKSPKLTGKEKDTAKKQELIAEGRRLREEVAGLETQGQAVEAELKTALLAIPNMTHPDAPVGSDPTGTTRSSRSGASRASSTSPPRTTSPWPRRSTWSISRPAPRWRGRSSTSSRTRPCCWSWPWCSTPCRHADPARLHADHHAGPGPGRGAGGHRLHPATPTRKRTSTPWPTPTCA